MFKSLSEFCAAAMLACVFAAGATAQDGFGEDGAKPEKQAAEAGFVDNDNQSVAKKELAEIENAMQDESDPEKIFDLTVKAGPIAYLAGDMTKARMYGNDALKRAGEFAESWNYGNAIHIGNIVLGLVELTDGKDGAAKRYLLAAGKTKGSPQLGSFGPNMLLARDFLAKGERSAVLQYFDLCAKFWKSNRGRLAEWKAAIARNEMPDFGPHIQYGGF